MTPYEAYSECYKQGKRIPELEGIISTGLPCFLFLSVKKKRKFNRINI